MSFFIKNEGLVKLRKIFFLYGHFSKWFLAEGRFPAISDFLGSGKSGNSQSLKVQNRKIIN